MLEPNHKKSKIKNYVEIGTLGSVIAFVSTLGIVSVYDLVVYDITNTVGELCQRYGLLISPAC